MSTATLETLLRSALSNYLAGCGFISWVSSEYRAARRSLIDSRVILFETVGENPYLLNSR
jgi:hypothetical protein